MSPKRALCYRFLSLPVLTQWRVAQQLDLLQQEDRGSSEEALFERIYERASAQGTLDRLRGAVEAAASAS